MPTGVKKWNANTGFPIVLAFVRCYALIMNSSFQLLCCLHLWYWLFSDIVVQWILEVACSAKPDPSKHTTLAKLTCFIKSIHFCWFNTNYWCLMLLKGHSANAWQCCYFPYAITGQYNVFPEAVMTLVFGLSGSIKEFTSGTSALHQYEVSGQCLLSPYTAACSC